MQIRKIDNDTLAFEYDTGYVRLVSRATIEGWLADLAQSESDSAQAQADAMQSMANERAQLSSYLALLEQA